MSNVLQTNIYMFLHILKQSFSEGTLHELGFFFGGMCPKTKVGACVKTR
jgi:hypothetical protein